MTTITDQVLELSGWRTAWMHEARGAHGEWVRAVGGIESETRHVEVRGRQEAVRSAQRARRVASDIRQDAAKRTPTGLLHQQIRDIELQRQQAMHRLPQPQIAGPWSPAAKSILTQESPASGSGQQFGPMRLSVSQAIPAIDHRVVVAYSANARNVIARAAQQGTLTAEQAKTIGDAVDSLTKTAQAADRQIQQLQDAQNRTTARMDTLEQAMRDLHARQSAELNNERIKDRIMSIRQKHDELLASARENAAAKSRMIIGVGASLSNLAMTIAAFMGLPGGMPVSGHEWMLAIIPVATAVGVTFVQPLYERMQEKRLAAKTDKLRQQEAAAAAMAEQLQSGKPISTQLANNEREDAAVDFLVQCFTQCGLDDSQARELAEDLIATR